jgi:hypothetical protein
MRHIRLGCNQLAALRFFQGVFESNGDGLHSYDKSVRRVIESLTRLQVLENYPNTMQAKLRPVPLTFALLRNNGRCNF